MSLPEASSKLYGGTCDGKANSDNSVGEVQRREGQTQEEDGHSTHLQVEGGGAFADSARCVVVGTVAGAEVSVVVTGTVDWHTAKVSADSQDNEPLGIFDTDGISLRVAHGAQISTFGFSNLFRGTAADKHGLATPFNSDGVTDVDGRQVNFQTSEGQDVLGSVHGVCTDERKHATHANCYTNVNGGR